MRNYANDKGRRGRLRARLEREKDERSWEKSSAEGEEERGRRTSGKSERRATYRGGGTEDNKCQNNDLAVASQTTRQIDHRGRNLYFATQFKIIKSFFLPSRDIDMLYICILQMKN